MFGFSPLGNSPTVISAPTPTAVPASLPQGAPATARLQQLAIFGAPALPTLIKQARDYSPDAASINVSYQLPERKAALNAQLIAQGQMPEAKEQSAMQVLNGNASPHREPIIRLYVAPHSLPQSAIVRDMRGSVQTSPGAPAYSAAGNRLETKTKVLLEEDEALDA